MKWINDLMLNIMLVVEYTYRCMAGRALKGSLTKKMLTDVSTEVLMWEIDTGYVSKEVSGRGLKTIRVNFKKVQELVGPGLATQLRIDRAVFNGLYDSNRRPGGNNWQAKISLSESSSQMFGIGMLIMFILSLSVAGHFTLIDKDKVGAFVAAWILTTITVEIFFGKMVMVEVIECNRNMAQSILEINDRLADEIPVIGEARNRARIASEVHALILDVGIINKTKRVSSAL